MIKEENIKELELKLKKYEDILAKRSLGYGDVVRSGSVSPYEQQLNDDTSVLRGIIQEIKDEIKTLKT